MHAPAIEQHFSPYSYREIIIIFEKHEGDKHRKCSGADRVDIDTLLLHLKKNEFVFLVHLWKAILSLADCSLQLFQSKKCDLSVTVHLLIAPNKDLKEVWNNESARIKESA